MLTPHATEMTLPSDTEVRFRRTFAAPPALVFRAWTDPEKLPRWWGPVGFRNSTLSIDVRPGGHWSYIMHGPDGRDYRNHIQFLEVTPPRRLVYKHGGDADAEPVNFSVTVEFAPAGPGGRETELTMRLVFPSRDARDFVLREYNAGEGGKQTIARLAEFVEGDPGPAEGPGRPFAITRVFRGPRDRVYEAWTREDLLRRWFGPKGTTTPRCRLDLRVGGMFHYAMQSEQGVMWARWVFREIDPGRRLVFVLSFSDEDGRVVQAPFGDWPMEMLHTVTFDDHAGIGRGTVVTVTVEPLAPTPAQAAVFDGHRGSMTNGWSGTFERLEGVLSGS